MNLEKFRKVSVCICLFVSSEERKSCVTALLLIIPLLIIAFLFGQFSLNLTDRRGLQETKFPYKQSSLTAKERIVTLILVPPVLGRKVGRTTTSILSGSCLTAGMSTCSTV